MKRTCDALGTCQRREPACGGCDWLQREAELVRDIGQRAEFDLDEAGVIEWVQRDMINDEHELASFLRWVYLAIALAAALVATLGYGLGKLVLS